MIPSVGRIVHYKLTAQDAEQVNRRRADWQADRAEKVTAAIGYMAHVGNTASEGDVYPMLIVRVWGMTEGSSVNGQVFLDGNDTLWVTSVGQGDQPRQWHEPQRVTAGA